MKRVFIDGNQGTTGLRIFERLADYKGIEVVTLPEEKRKDIKARKQMLDSADIAFLCLPDDAAREAVSVTENPDTVIIDTSTAHRCDSSFAYGFPELGKEYAEKIKNSVRIAVPGCHASGFIALVEPLVKNNAISKDALLTCHSVTGYSGGGKKMIADYCYEQKSDLLLSPREYGLSQTHKHLPEMQKISGLSNAPIFCPIVSNYYSGMLVTVPLFRQQLTVSEEEIKNIYKSTYHDGLVKYADSIAEGNFVASNAKSGFDDMEISVEGNAERILLTARYDNLGKGASGAAIQCLNIKLGNSQDYHLTV